MKNEEIEIRHVFHKKNNTNSKQTTDDNLFS